MSKPIVVSISHSIDPDGIGSQAIIFRYFRELQIEPIGFLADYYNFEKVFKEALEMNPTILIVSDIGANKSYLLKIIDDLKNLQARKIWIDHHKMTPELRELIEGAVNELIHDTSVCAAELVQKRFMPNDEISLKIAEIAHNGDFDVQDRLANIVYTLIDYYRYKPEKLFNIREKFAQGDIDGDEITREYLEAYKVFEAERDRIRKEMSTRKIATMSVAIAESALLPRGKVTKFLSEICNEDILLAIDTTNFRIGLRSDTCDVAAIAAEFGGGGHKHRSGFTFHGALDENKNLNQDFLEKFEQAIIKNL